MDRKLLWYLVLIFGLVLDAMAVRLLYDPASSLISQVAGVTALVLIALAAPTVLILVLEFIFTGPEDYFARLGKVLPYFYIFVELLLISIIEAVSPP